MNIKFRENWRTRQVNVIDNDRVVFAHREYRGAAEWAQKTYSLTDAHLMEIYRDYKDDYDENG